MPTTYDVAANEDRAAQVVFGWRNLDNLEVAANVLNFYAAAGSPTPANFQGLADNLYSFWTGAAPFADGLKSDITEDWRLESITARTLDGVNQAFRSVSEVGAVAEETEPALLAPCVSLRTGLGGRSHRGRLYLPSPSHASVIDGLLGAAYITSMEAIWDDLRVTLPANTSVGWTWCVYSRKLDTMSVIEDVHINVELDTQRRRGKK